MTNLVIFFEKKGNSCKNFEVMLSFNNFSLKEKTNEDVLEPYL
jgi:hypothetical protein